jgi:uncharacterized membrane protein YfcA
VNPNLFALIAVGVAAGGLGALLGVGGGVILVPGLILVAGLPFHSAVAASLVCVVATSVSGSVVYLRRGRVELDAAVRLQLFTVLGAVAAGLAATAIPAGPLYVAFALLLVVTAVRMWPRGAREPAREHPVDGGRGAAAAGASVGAGAMAGLLGVGGGILNVPILHLLLGRPFDRAAATSVYMIGVTAAAAATVYLMRGDVEPGVAGVTLLGTLAGAGIAAAWGGRLDRRLLKMGFALLLLYVAVRMVNLGVATL